VLGAETKALVAVAPLLLTGVPDLPEPVRDQARIVTNDATGTLELQWTGALTPAQESLLRGASDSAGWSQGVDVIAARTRKTGGFDLVTKYVNGIAIGTLLLIGVVLTSSPVVYNTVERLQFWLVLLIVGCAVVLGILFIKPYAVWAMLRGMASLGEMPGPESGLEQMALLGALAFAGAGGTMNLGQSNFIKDKGYGMGKYIGRITSPITGNEEAIADVGYHFRHTPENMRRWRDWWRAANIEHFWSFFVTCVACLVLLSLLAYSLFYDETGQLRPEAANYGEDLNFIWGEANLIRAGFSSPAVGQIFRTLFFVMGMALLLTTELGVLDATVRISTDIIKVNFLRDNAAWSQSRLYFLLLWTEIAIGTAILLAGEYFPQFRQPMFLLKTSAAMNGGVMFIYTVILLYLNNKILSRSLSMSPLRFVAMVWGCGFFGYFTLLAIKHEVVPWMLGRQ